MSEEERPEEFESDDAPVPVVRRRVVKRKGSPRKALSQKKAKDANTNMQAMASVPPGHSPAHPAAVPSQAQSQPTFVPLATLPALFQSPMMNSTAHVPLQHFATPQAPGSHVSTLSLLNSLQDDKLALILPILVRMEHKIDQLVAMIGSRANLGMVASQSNFPVAAGQPIASMTGSQTSANMTGTHLNAQMIGGQPNAMLGTQVNAPMVGSQPNVMMGPQSNVTMMVNQSHAPEVGNQPNALMETQSNASIIATQPSVQVMGSHSNVAVGNQSNAVMGRQSSRVMAGQTQPSSQMVGSHSNTPAITNQVNAVTEIQSNSTLTGTQSSVQMMAGQSTANVLGTQMVASPSSAALMGSQCGVHMNGMQSNSETVAGQSNTSVMSSQANASVMGTQSNLGIQRQRTVMPSPTKIETSAEELSLVVGPEFALNPDEIIATRVRANSAMNFAVKLMRKIFSRDELVGRNVSGVRGKDKVDEKRVNVIRELVFKLYQTSPLEKETVWRNCHKAMDSYLRKMPHEIST